MLVGAVLAPTDPVFASAIVGRAEVPARLRSLLNVESGLTTVSRSPWRWSRSRRRRATMSPASTGVRARPGRGPRCRGVGRSARRLRSRFTRRRPARIPRRAVDRVDGPRDRQRHARQPVLAAFTAGITIATLVPEAWRLLSGEFGQLLTELLKLAAIFVLRRPHLARVPRRDPFLRLRLRDPGAVRRTAACHGRRAPAQPVCPCLETRCRRPGSGPKGFASVVYGLPILEADVPQADRMFHLVALAIVASILAHSSSDVPIAHAFARADERRRRQSEVRHRGSADRRSTTPTAAGGLDRTVLSERLSAAGPSRPAGSAEPSARDRSPITHRRPRPVVPRPARRPA